MKRFPAILTVTAIAALMGGLAVVLESIQEDGNRAETLPIAGADCSVEAENGRGPASRQSGSAGNANASEQVVPPFSPEETAIGASLPEPAEDPRRSAPSPIGTFEQIEGGRTDFVVANEYKPGPDLSMQREAAFWRNEILSSSRPFGVAASEAIAGEAVQFTGGVGAFSQDPYLRPEVVEADEPLVTPLEVIQVASRGEDDLLELSYSVLLDDDPLTVTPNGLILTQEIPEGWQVVAADPQLQAVDEQSRMVKWLFVGQEVESKIVYSLSMRVPEGAEGNWNEMLAWYTYRQEDGSCVDVAVGTVPESDIQPGY